MYEKHKSDPEIKAKYEDDDETNNSVTLEEMSKMFDLDINTLNKLMLINRL
jgi:hypothetical protein